MTAAQRQAVGPDSMDGSYYAKDGMVWKSPKITPTGDGLTSLISIGFPVCTLHDAVSEQGDAVAELLNRGEQFADLVAALESAAAVLSGERMTKQALIDALEQIRAALAKARGG